MHWKCALAGVAFAIALAPTSVSADSVTEIENARAKERSGLYLNGRDREQLRRWGAIATTAAMPIAPTTMGMTMAIMAPTTTSRA